MTTPIVTTTKQQITLIETYLKYFKALNEQIRARQLQEGATGLEKLSSDLLADIRTNSTPAIRKKQLLGNCYTLLSAVYSKLSNQEAFLKYARLSHEVAKELVETMPTNKDGEEKQKGPGSLSILHQSGQDTLTDKPGKKTIIMIMMVYQNRLMLLLSFVEYRNCNERVDKYLCAGSKLKGYSYREE